MIQIRRNTFETNSSSTHSLSIISPRELKDWKDDELLYDTHSDRLVSKFAVEQEEDFMEEYSEVVTPQNLETCVDAYIRQHRYSGYCRYRSYDSLDVQEEPVYDRYGNAQVAVSVYYSD